MQENEEVMYKVSDIQLSTSKAGNKMLVVKLILDPSNLKFNCTVYIALIKKMEKFLEDFKESIGMKNLNAQNMSQAIGLNGHCSVCQKGGFNGKKYWSVKSFVTNPQLPLQIEKEEYIDNDIPF